MTIESCYAGATPTLSISVIAAGVEYQDEFINLFRLIGDLPISQRKKKKKVRNIVLVQSFNVSTHL